MTSIGAPSKQGEIEVRLMGQPRFVVDGRELRGRSPRGSAMIARLALDAGSVVPREQLIEDVWDGEVLSSGPAALRTQVRRLRSALDKEGVGHIVRTANDGYVLDVDPMEVDVYKAERLLDTVLADVASETEERTQKLRKVWDLINATPLQGLEEFEFAASHSARLAALAEVARLEYARALVGSGSPETAISVLKDAVHRDVLAAEPVALTVEAHYRAGRPHDGLALVEAHRQAMLDLGLVVSEQVRIAEGIALGVEESRPGRPTSLVGRAEECEALATALEDLGSGALSGRVVTVVGEAGVGKSELLNWLVGCAELNDVQVLRGSGDPLGNDFPLLAVREALSPLGGVRRVLDDSLERSSNDAETDIVRATNEASLQWQRLSVAESVVSELEGAFSAPYVVVIDDLHWVDASSRAVLRAIGRLASWAPVLLVLAGRPEGDWLDSLATSSSLNLMPLPLDVESGRTMAQALVGASLGPSLAGAVDRAGGVPLLIVELIRGLRAERRLRAGDAVELIGDSAPTSLRELVRRRLGPLSTDVRRLCEMAALLGAEARVDVVGPLLKATPIEVNELVTAAVAADLLTSTSTSLAFRHDLVREAVAEAVPPAVRASLHREMASLHAARGAPITAVAAHAALAAALEDDKQLITWLREAADATSILEPETSLKLLDRALEIGPAEIDVRYGLLRAKVEALTNSGQIAEAAALLDAVLEMDPDRAADALLRLAGLKLLSNDTVGAREVLERGLARDPGEPVNCRLHALMGLCCTILLDREGAEHWSGEAERLGMACGDLVARSIAAGMLGRLRCLEFDPGALADNRRSVELANADPTGQAHGYEPNSFLVMAAIDLGLHEEAEAAIAAGRAVAQRVHTPWVEPLLQALEMLLQYRRDEKVEVDATATEILDRRSLVGAGMVDAWAETMLALRALRDGNVDQARSLITAAKAEESPNTLGEDFGVCVDAQLLAIDGDVKAGFDHVAGAWEICGLIGAKIWFQVMASTAIRLGLLSDQREQVEQMVQDCEWIRDRTDAPIHRALAARARALFDGDVDAMREAVALYEETDWVLETADAAVELAAMEAGRPLPATFLPALPTR